MPSANKPSHITRGDIFDDLDLSPEESAEARIKADLWQAIIQRVRKAKLTPAQTATALHLHQPDVSNLMAGKLSKFSISMLIRFSLRLNLSVRLTVSKPLKPVTARVPSRSKRKIAA